jgi:hypothetical protein
MEGVIQYAHEYLTEEEAGTSSTYRELLGVLRCLHAVMHLCEGKFVVFQVDAENLLGIVNRGSPKLHINVVARELFWLCVKRDITLSVEWVPRELNSLADEISKFLIPSDWMLNRRIFRRLEERWGRHSVDLFASDANFQCERFYSLHWCRGSAGCDAFAFAWGGEGACWVNCPYRVLGRVWRKLRSDGARATILVPLWESATWWGLLAPDGVHLSEEVIDGVWLDRSVPDLFVPGTAPGGRAVAPPDWHVMAVRVDFSAGRRHVKTSRQDRCTRGGCAACRCRSWHR